VLDIEDFMNSIFTFPLSLVGFSALGVLAGIYLLHNRYRNHTVSSLIFWLDHVKPREGGLNISRLQLPLLFLVEFLAIVFLVLGSAGPLVRRGNEDKNFLFVLDDSYSMLGGVQDSSRDLGERAVKGILNEAGGFRASFIRAGAEAVVIGEGISSLNEAERVMEGWRCYGERFDLEVGLNLAMGTARAGTRIMVITDGSPEYEPEGGELRVSAYGEVVDNFAIVNVSRKAEAERDRCMAAVANYSGSLSLIRVGVYTLDDVEFDAPEDVSFEAGYNLFVEEVEVAAGGIERLFFDVEKGTGDLVVVIEGEGDGLGIDDRAYLLSPDRKRLRVDVEVGDAGLAGAISSAISANGSLVRRTEVGPEVVFTDNSDRSASVDQWLVRFVNEPNSAAFLGPFITNKSHPLLEGVNFEGVIWSASRDASMRGELVLSAGDVPLLRDYEDIDGKHILSVNLDSELSTVTSSANWPVMFYNLFNWRKQYLPGLSRRNIKLGGRVYFQSVRFVNDLSVTDPLGREADYSSSTGEFSIMGSVPGVYEVESNDDIYRFAVNACRAGESDFRDKESGDWGSWDEAGSFRWEYVNIDWFFLLGGLVMLSFHRYLCSSVKGVRG
jgi:hypothetical protein